MVHVNTKALKGKGTWGRSSGPRGHSSACCRVSLTLGAWCPEPPTPVLSPGPLLNRQNVAFTGPLRLLSSLPGMLSL